MLSIFVMIFGLAGTAGLWKLAWYILNQTAEANSNQTEVYQPAWTHTPAAEQTSPGEPPPDWLFSGQAVKAPRQEAAVQPRKRASSNDNTQFFCRDEIDTHSEKTEILGSETSHDDLSPSPSTNKARPAPPPPPGTSPLSVPRR